MLNCMQVVIENEDDLNECYARLEALEALGVGSDHAREHWNEPDILARSLEWNLILNGLLVWEIDHRGKIRPEWSQLGHKENKETV